MYEVTATEAARRFSDLLDAVEHDGESFSVVRRGKVVAHIGPVSRGRGADVKELLRQMPPDEDWAPQLAEVRALLEIDPRG